MRIVLDDSAYRTCYIREGKERVMNKIEAFVLTGKTLALWTVYPIIALWRAFTTSGAEYSMSVGAFGLIGLMIAASAIVFAAFGQLWIAAGVAVGYYLFGLVANTSLSFGWKDDLF